MTTVEISKPCPECGRELKIRTNRKTETQFISCSGFPDCRYTETISENLKMELMGHPTLFDVPTEPVVDRPVFRCTRRSRKS